MKVRTILRSERQAFFDHFSRLHGGAIITMNVSDDVLGSRDAVVEQPLQRITSSGDDLLIQIGGRRRTDQLGHRLANVRSVNLQQTDEGADAALDIAAADGTRTVVRFRSPMLPELLELATE